MEEPPDVGWIFLCSEFFNIRKRKLFKTNEESTVKTVFLLFLIIVINFMF